VLTCYKHGGWDLRLSHEHLTLIGSMPLRVEHLGWSKPKLVVRSRLLEREALYTVSTGSEGPTFGTDSTRMGNERSAAGSGPSAGAPCDVRPALTRTPKLPRSESRGHWVPVYPEEVVVMRVTHDANLFARSGTE
jgi:hypothetical protein